MILFQPIKFFIETLVSRKNIKRNIPKILMLSLFLSSILAAGTDAAGPDAGDIPKPALEAGGLSTILTVLLIADLIFLLYVVFGPDNSFKEYTRFLLLVHGSLPAIWIGMGFLGPMNLYLFMGSFVLIVVLYFFLCRNELFVQIITIVNCCLLVTLVMKSLLGNSQGAMIGTGTGFLIACGIFIFLGITRFETLYKIHTIFVCYIIITYLVEFFTNIPVLSDGSKDITSISTTVLLGIVVFGVLTYLLFFK